MSVWMNATLPVKLGFGASLHQINCLIPWTPLPECALESRRWRRRVARRCRHHHVLAEFPVFFKGLPSLRCKDSEIYAAPATAVAIHFVLISGEKSFSFRMSDEGQEVPHRACAHYGTSHAVRACESFANELSLPSSKPCLYFHIAFLGGKIPLHFLWWERAKVQKEVTKPRGFMFKVIRELFHSLKVLKARKQKCYFLFNAISNGLKLKAFM